jgi:hypothetical protein
VVDLVAENDKGDVGELLHAEKRVELSLGLSKTLVVLGIDEEDDAADLGEVVAPQAAGLGVATEIERCELNVAYRQLFGGWGGLEKEGSAGTRDVLGWRAARCWLAESV